MVKRLKRSQGPGCHSKRVHMSVRSLAAIKPFRIQRNQFFAGSTCKSIFFSNYVKKFHPLVLPHISFRCGTPLHLRLLLQAQSRTRFKVRPFFRFTFSRVFAASIADGMANAEKIRRAKVAHEKSLRDEVRMEIAE